MSAPGAPRLSVLLIEDNPGDARLIREMLAEVNAPVALTRVERLGDGVEHLGRDGADVVLLDLSLPDCHGLETFTRLRDAAPQAPVVVLTGLDDETTAVRALHEGAQDYLTKGRVDGNLLLRSMRYAVERKRAEEERARLLARERAARAEAEQLAAERAAILGRIADGVIAADTSGRITYVNEAARRLYGVAELGMPLQTNTVFGEASALDGGNGSPDDLPLARAALHGETVVGAELRIRRPDGSEMVALASATPVVAEGGERLGAVLTLHDVTAQRDLERQKDEFLSNISHDLKTPLTAIKASIGVVLANEPPGVPAPLHLMFANIDQAADRMAALVEDLLELTRLQAGRVQLRLDRVDLRDVARRAARAIEPLVHEREQRLRLTLPRRTVEARVDVQRLERALLNLLSNACKYGRTGGTIRLSLATRNGRALFGVADNGPGIPEAEQARIFERFYRPEDDTTRRTQGSGLGLPIARAMVELHDGRLWLESTPGKGSTFFIALPLEGPAQGDQAGGREGAGLGETRGD